MFKKILLTLAAALALFLIYVSTRPSTFTNKR